VRPGQRGTLALAATAAVIVACVALVGADRGSSASRLSAVVYERGGDLYAVAVDGSRTVRLTRTRVRETDPAVSPDGTMIAFARVFGSDWSRGLSIIRIDGSHERVLTRQPDVNPTWSPGGGTIYFSRLFAQRGGATCGELFRIPAWGGRARIIPVTPRGRSSRSHLDPAVSPDGRRIAFTDWDLCEGGTASPRLSVVDGTGRRTRDLVRLRRNGHFPDPEHYCPAWAPDGRRIAFVVDRDLYVANVDGTGVHRLSREGGSYFDCPEWSPDGRWIAYSAGGVLRVVHPDGSSRLVIGRRGRDSYTVGGWLTSLRR
jgi:Tol biopolymer transport system component